jgi:RNA polymerase sigma-B factor
MGSFTLGLAVVGKTTAERERLLLERYRKTADRAARDQLVERFLPLADRVARRYSKGHESPDDLRQVAGIGLVKAIERCDADRGVPFPAFAIATISGEIKRHHRDHYWSLHVPRPLKERALRVQRLQADRATTGRDAVALGQVAAAAGLTEAETIEAIEAMTAMRVGSLEALRAEQSEVLERSAEDRGYAQADARQTLAALMSGMEPRDRAILYLRFVEDLTQDSIGERLGISQMQVSRLLGRAVTRLHRNAAGE